MLWQSGGSSGKDGAGDEVRNDQKGQLMKRLSSAHGPRGVLVLPRWTAYQPKCFSYFHRIFGGIGYLNCIMAESKRNSEFLGGGPKFNTVGKDNRPAPGTEEPTAAPNQAGYWLRVSTVILVVAVLAGLLFYLNDHDLGKTAVPGGRAVSPDAPAVNPDAKPSPE